MRATWFSFLAGDVSGHMNNEWSLESSAFPQLHVDDSKMFFYGDVVPTWHARMLTGSKEQVLFDLRPYTIFHARILPAIICMTASAYCHAYFCGEYQRISDGVLVCASPLKEATLNPTKYLNRLKLKFIIMVYSYSVNKRSYDSKRDSE